MNKKGFTLVELLAVIIILSLLALIASTSVTKVVRDSKTDLYNTQIELIKAAAEAWGADNLYKLPDANTCKFMTLYDLKSYGLVDSDITNPKTGELFSDDMIIKISGEQNKYGNTNVVYEVDAGNIKDCESIYPKICILVDDADKSGTISTGDKYQCKVKIDASYNFYVLSLNDNGTTNLILDRNICSDGTLTDANKADKCFVAYNVDGDASNAGPVTAMTYLNMATSSWSNISNLNISYDDEEKHFKNFEITGKARLPYYSEVNEAGCGYDDTLTCPVWIVDYLQDAGQDYDTTYQKNPISGIRGYWTLSSFTNYSDRAWTVDFSGDVDFQNVDNNDYHGIRPVITVPNFNMS